MGNPKPGFVEKPGFGAPVGPLTVLTRCVMLFAMDRITLLPARDVTPVDRAAVLNAAYADYCVPLQMSPDQLEASDAFYDVDLALSLVARVGSELAGMALLSRREARGWVSAVGVAPGQRRQGIARRLMEGLVANARSAGLRDLTLEVIDENTAARQLYRSLGFYETRELLCWRFLADADRLPIPRERLAPVPAEKAWQHFGAWHDQPPCWQREEATLRRMAGRARTLSLSMDNSPAAYCIVHDRADAVAILDVGINPGFGPVAAGRVLLQALAAIYGGRALTIVNIPVDAGLNRALAALHFLVTIRQWEMRLAL